MICTPAAVAFLIRWEVTSEGWYNSNAIHPDWPGGESGVTLGIGYDCSAQSDAQIIHDWIGLGMPCATLLSKCAGLRGAHAETALRFVRMLTVPYTLATSVFESAVLPRYATQTESTLPNCADLNGNQFGALVSIGYNRGNEGWVDDDERHVEMNAIHLAMTGKNFASIPTSIRAMQRLWPEGSDLWKRRAAEAAFFEELP